MYYSFLAGPNSLARIQQEVTAVRMAVSKDVVGMGPAKDRKPSLPAGNYSTQLSQSSQGDSVANDTKYCTSVDSLGAFYYLSVLNHLIDAGDHVMLETDSDTEDSNSVCEQSPQRKLTILDEDTRNTNTHGNGDYQREIREDSGHDLKTVCNESSVNVETCTESTDSVEKMLLDTVERNKSEDIASSDPMLGGDTMPSSEAMHGIETMPSNAAVLSSAAMPGSVVTTGARLVDSVVSMEGSMDSVHLSTYDVVPKDIKIGEEAGLPGARSTEAKSINGDLNKASDDGADENSTEVCDNGHDVSQEKANGENLAKYVICAGSLKILSWSLLWDSQAKRNQLLAASQEIQRALARLTANHKQNGELSYNAAGHYLTAPPALQRSISGEYMHMKPGSPQDSPVKDLPYLAKNRISTGSIDEECEWMEMRDPNIEPAIEENHALEDTSVSMTQSGIMQTRIYSKAHEIFSGMSQSGCESVTSLSHDQSNGEPAAPSNPNITISDQRRTNADNSLSFGLASHGDCIENRPSNQINLEEPVSSDINGARTDDAFTSPLSQDTDWLDLPIDLKYCDPRVTLSDLSMEQVKVNKELHNLTCQLQVRCQLPQLKGCTRIP